MEGPRLKRCRRAHDTKERVGRTIDSFWVGNLPDVVKAPDPNLGSVNEATRISLPVGGAVAAWPRLVRAADPEVADRRFSRPTEPSRAAVASAGRDGGTTCLAFINTPYRISSVGRWCNAKGPMQRRARNMRVIRQLRV